MSETLTILPDKKSSYTHFPTLPEDIAVSSTLFEELWSIHPESYGKIKIMGKEINTPRWQESFGKDYHYSGINHTARPVSTHPYLSLLLEWVRNHSKKNYEQILINWYKDGNHYIGWHSDDEKQLVKNSSIYSFSFGQARDFDIKSKPSSGFKFQDRVKLENNSMIIMEGEFQKKI